MENLAFRPFNSPFDAGFPVKAQPTFTNLKLAKTYLKFVQSQWRRYDVFTVNIEQILNISLLFLLLTLNK